MFEKFCFSSEKVSCYRNILHTCRNILHTFYILHSTYVLDHFSFRCKSEINGCSKCSVAFRKDTFQKNLTFKVSAKSNIKLSNLLFKYIRFLFFDLSVFYLMSFKGVIMWCYMRSVVMSFNSKILQNSFFLNSYFFHIILFLVKLQCHFLLTSTLSQMVSCQY